MINLRISDKDGNFFIVCHVLAIVFNNKGQIFITFEDDSTAPKTNIYKVDQVVSLELC